MRAGFNVEISGRVRVRHQVTGCVRLTYDLFMDFLQLCVLQVTLSLHLIHLCSNTFKVSFQSRVSGLKAPSDQRAPNLPSSCDRRSDRTAGSRTCSRGTLPAPMELENAACLLAHASVCATKGAVMQSEQPRWHDGTARKRLPLPLPCAAPHQQEEATLRQIPLAEELVVANDKTGTYRDDARGSLRTFDGR